MNRRLLPYIALTALVVLGVGILGLGWIDTGDSAETSPPKAVTGAESISGAGTEAAPLMTGAVDPGGLDTTYQFEYVAARDFNPGAKKPYEQGGRAPAAPATVESDSSGKKVAVDAPLPTFEPGTTYHYRVVASNDDGVSAGADETFVAPPACQGNGGECAWSVQRLANPGSSTSNVFEDVSCADSSMCVAIGTNRFVDESFAESWDGKEWRTIGTFPGRWKAISCPTASHCVAVDNRPATIWSLDSSGGGNFKVDSVIPPRPQGAAELELNDISCVSEKSCVAAGTYWKSSYTTYIVRWDGARWKLEPPPSPQSGISAATHGMLGVSCISSPFCATVGAFQLQPFVEHWESGSGWTSVKVPHLPEPKTASLEGISCTAPDACMAVGSQGDDGGAIQPFAERWDGRRWSIVDTPELEPKGYALLRGVFCLSANSCVAVGNFAYPFSVRTVEKTIVMTWDGTEWTLQTSPNPDQFNALVGVSCSSPVACMAVGHARPNWQGKGSVPMIARLG